VRNSGELKQQHGCEDSQGFVPKLAEAGAAADVDLGTERMLLPGFGARSTVVHERIVSPTAAVSQAPNASSEQHKQLSRESPRLVHGRRHRGAARQPRLRSIGRSRRCERSAREGNHA